MKNRNTIWTGLISLSALIAIALAASFSRVSLAQNGAQRNSRARSVEQFPQPSPTPPKKEDEVTLNSDEVVRVETNLTNIFFTAADKQKRFVSTLKREDVRLRLESYGVNPSDVKARVAALGDQEVAQLAARIDTLPAGADGLGALVGALVLIFLVLLITDLLGLTHVFPFTKPIR